MSLRVFQRTVSYIEGCTFEFNQHLQYQDNRWPEPYRLLATRAFCSIDAARIVFAANMGLLRPEISHLDA